MNLIQALILGIVQGATEFIPVSSSAHLVLVPWWLGWGDVNNLAFDTILHLGTLLAVVAYFFPDLVRIVRAWLGRVILRQPRSFESSLGWWIIIGTVPAAILGAAFQSFFENVFGDAVAVAALLLITGIILVLAERFTNRWRDLEDLFWVDVLLIGMAQAFAILPGISRSGATIATGLGRGLKREEAARFSFLLSIPIILGAGLKNLADITLGATVTAGAPELIVGFLAAAIVGYLSIRYLLRYLQTNTLYPFAFYCWAVGLLSLIGAFVL